MTPEELEELIYFRPGECFLNGTLIDWETIDTTTMFYVEQVRQRLESPVRLIRGAHPNRPSAIDACCPERTLRQVFMELTRLPCSWGIYSGNSFHLDTRDEDVPARWLAVKSGELVAVQAQGLERLITNEADGWLYLQYDFGALILVCGLADQHRADEQKAQNVA